MIGCTVIYELFKILAGTRSGANDVVNVPLVPAAKLCTSERLVVDSQIDSASISVRWKVTNSINGINILSYRTTIPLTACQYLWSSKWCEELPGDRRMKWDWYSTTRPRHLMELTSNLNSGISMRQHYLFWLSFSRQISAHLSLTPAIHWWRGYPRNVWLLKI